MADFRKALGSALSKMVRKGICLNRGWRRVGGWEEQTWRRGGVGGGGAVELGVQVARRSRCVAEQEIEKRREGRKSRKGNLGDPLDEVVGWAMKR